MFRRAFTCVLFGCCLSLLAQAAVTADDKKGGTHEGTVVSAVEGKLTMTDKAGKEHSHMIAASAKVTLDGKDAALTDLKKGDKVKITTDDGGKVTAIAATRDEKK